jgi:ribonuclease P protein component
MTEVGRLTKRPEFLRVAGGRRKWVMPGVVVQALPREAAAEARTDRAGDEGAAPAPARLGITVSRKVGNSVQRNRARRRLRAAARTVLPESGRPGYDYVVIGRKATLTRPYADLVADLRTAVRKLSANGHRPREDSEHGSRGHRRDKRER